MFCFVLQYTRVHKISVTDDVLVQLHEQYGLELIYVAENQESNAGSSSSSSASSARNNQRVIQFL